VPPDDVRGYGDAILRLADDPVFYESRMNGCRGAQEQFYDLDRGWGAALRRALAPLRKRGHCLPQQAQSLNSSQTQSRATSMTPLVTPQRSRVAG
jgi:hypothetical protein